MGRKSPCEWYAVCPLRAFHEKRLVDEKWVADYCLGDFSRCVRRKMEEEGISHPDNMMPDGTVDERLG